MTSENPDRYQLSRRKVLGGLSAVGLASAGAGLGTSAYFSDTETYANNRLTAGSLDLVVDWEEHYSDWSEDEVANPANGQINWSMTEPANPADYVTFPLGAADPTVWVDAQDEVGPNGESSLELFMDNTTLESYPDADNNRVQDSLLEYEACRDLAQAGANPDGSFSGTDLDPRQTKGPLDASRSDNDDTIVRNDLGEVVEIKPLVSLDDVKPGDFGELTLSLHLCDNPGYVWLQGELVNASENGLTEPEASDPDEDGDPDGDGDLSDSNVELLDAIQTMLWYDEDGDNVYEPGGREGDAEVVIVLDRSGSMGSSANPNSKISRAKDGAIDLVNSLGDAASVGVVAFGSSATDIISLTPLGSGGRANVVSAIEGIGSTGQTTNIESAVDDAQTMLAGGSSANDIMVLLSDGAPNVNGDGDNEGDPDFGNFDPADNAQAAKDAGTEIFTIGYDLTDADTIALMEEMASPPPGTHAYTDVEIDQVEQVFAQIGQIIAGEECFFQGSLRSLLNLASATGPNEAPGIPLDGNRATPFEEVTGADTDGDGIVDSNFGLGDGTDPNRDEYVDSTTNAIGLSWWLPVDHANEIQTDRVEFDLGFYTEQARHNTGEGQAPEQ